MDIDKLFVKGFYKNDPAYVSELWWLAFITSIIILATALSFTYNIEVDETTLWVIGVIGLWRYSWKALHLIRGVYYEHVRYPVLKSLADIQLRPPAVCVVIPCFRTNPEIISPVFKALLDEIEDFGVSAHVVACITDEADMNLIERQFEKLRGQVPINLHIIYQDGTGKRSTMADALTLLVEKANVPKAGVMILMDGDTVIPTGTLQTVSRFFMKYHDLGALTTNNEPFVRGGSVSRQWYRQRMALRHFYMCSLSLDSKVLVLTGRFSAFRSSVALSHEFIESLRNDYLKHWRYGKIRMLTGDDKSTWHYILKNRWKMLYLPDVIVGCLEDAPSSNFFRSSISLMTRWYGNMLRGNIRSMAISPNTTGWFLWFCLLDQRVSMLTTLIGPILALTMSAYLGVSILVSYLLWVILTRSAHVLLIAISSGKIHPLFVALLWYEQLVGSLLKIYLLFHPNIQKWTRQDISIHTNTSTFNDKLKIWIPHIETAAVLCVLITFILFMY
ncbi:glycosyltransferase [Vibrio penaeicida]|uniref:glycosyltransferase n=1 Tax=Vibrio penaeicida TaxID=104609 RepID=UPI002734E34E|nr:glycosyltransferase [Vibrio penaeicida]MDP2574661.1 glycosyltransferase [Vibrio penaeicida]